MSQEDLDLAKELLGEINVLDRNAFTTLIDGASLDADSLSAGLIVVLYEQLTKLYSLTKTERDAWSKAIELLPDRTSRDEWKLKRYQVLLNDVQNTEFITDYVTFLLEKGILDDEDRFKEVIDRSLNYDFQNSQGLFRLGIEFIKSSDFVSSGKLTLRDQYLKRLQIKHRQIDETFQEFSHFISQNFPEEYDHEMLYASKVYNATKECQQDWELAYAQGYSDKKSQWFSLLKLAESVPKRKRNAKELITIFENAIAVVDDIDIWQTFLVVFDEYHEKVDNNNEMLKYLSRYVKHFPYTPQPYIEILRGIPTRYDAGIFDSIEARMLNFLDGNFDYDYTEWKELAIAHLRILFKLKDPKNYVSAYFEKALDCEADVFHSVERFIVRCFEKMGLLGEAREHLRSLTDTFSKHAEVWLLSYYFEKEHGDLDSVSKVLNAALNKCELMDWPERIIEEYQRFAEFNEMNYKTILLKINRKKKQIAKMRAEQQVEVMEEDETDNKRRIDDSVILDTGEGENKAKKRKTETTRNREIFTVAVNNLPDRISEKQLLHFFKDCGEIYESKFISTEDTKQAHLEFTNEQDVLKALTKDYKRLGGSEIRVQRLMKNTIWVANFPPTFTQLDLERLFSQSGKVISVRLPSLKFNATRRFCYVEFSTTDAASLAVGDFNGREIGGFKLTVKISDPTSKQNRSGAVEEGREVFVGKLDFHKVTALKMRELFEKFGTVQNVHLPLSQRGKEEKRKNDGYGFVTFEKPEEALASLQLNRVSFEGRVIEVTISKKKTQKEKQKERKALRDYRNSDSVIALKGLPETFNAEQLRKFFSDFAEVQDVVLEPKANGAVVVFESAKDAGEVALKTEGAHIAEYEVQLTTVAELQKDTDVRHMTTKPTIKGPSLVPSSLRRKPKVGSAPVTSKVVRTNSTDKEQTDSQLQQFISDVKKTNSDFRAMLLGTKD